MIISPESHVTKKLSAHSIISLAKTIEKHKEWSEGYFAAFKSPHDNFFHMPQKHYEFARLLKRILQSNKLEYFPLHRIEQRAHMLANLNEIHPII